MDPLKSIIPSQFLGERGSNLVIINPGSANVRIGLAQYDEPLNIPHCIARKTIGANKSTKKNIQDQGLNTQVTTAQHIERENAYDKIALLMKIPFLDEEVANNAFPQKMGRVDGHPAQNTKKETALTYTDVFEKVINPTSTTVTGHSDDEEQAIDSPSPGDSNDSAHGKPNSSDKKYREYICGEEAMRISSAEPYCLRRPIRRGHLNISQYYPAQQVLEDLHAIWDWILTEKMNIQQDEMTTLACILVLPETFDNREIKEMLTIVLRDLGFGSAVVHQEGLAAAFGNGLSTTCIVNLGAQVTSVVCVEDGAILPMTQISLRYGGEDISRCLLWTQRHHQTWPPVRTDSLTKPVDLLMLNRLRESHCSIREGQIESVAVVHSYEDGMPATSHRTRLTALNVPPMGLFYPPLLVPDVYPPPPRTWFKDHDDMLEDTWHSEGLYPGGTSSYPMWESYPAAQARPRREINIDLGEAIAKSILSAGRIDLQRKLFCSMQLIGGVALTEGLTPAVEERVLHAIPPSEAIDTVDVLQSRTNPNFVCWKGGVVLGVLDYGREAWIHREDWIQNGIHVGSGRKYKDSYYLQAQASCYITI